MNNYQSYPQGLADPSTYRHLLVNNRVDNGAAFQTPRYRNGLYGDLIGYPYPVHGQDTVHQPTPVVQNLPQGGYPPQASECYPRPSAPPEYVYQPAGPNYAPPDGAANPPGIAAIHPGIVVAYPDSPRAVKVPAHGKYFYLINNKSGLALNVLQNSNYDKIPAGLEVILSSINDPNIQRWCAHDENESKDLNESRIIRNASNNSLVLEGRANLFGPNRVRLVQYTLDKAEQQWILGTDGRIRNTMRRDECLDVENGGEGRFVIASKIKDKQWSQIWRMKIAANNDSQ